MPASRAPFKVLIVDDSPAVREALRWVLEDADDFRVAGEAADGIEAADRAAELLPDIVLLDFELPGQDGCAVARFLKAMPHPPVVVFLTVHGDWESRHRAMESGGDSFAEKGVGWAALMTQMRSSLANRPEELP